MWICKIKEYVDRCKIKALEHKKESKIISFVQSLIAEAWEAG